MKRRAGTLVREITQNQARIAELGCDQVRIFAEIERLKAANKANLMALLDQVVGRLDLGQLNVDNLLSSISKLAESGADHTVSRIEPIESDIRVVVRLSRNASASNLKTIKAAGLRWNGRLGGWTGHVTSAELDELRRLFGERVEEPKQASAAQDTGAPIETVPQPGSADVKGTAVSVEEEQAQFDEGTSSTSAATSKLRLSFGAFPVRRSLT